MTKYAILGLTALLASGCYFDQQPLPPSSPYTYGYSQSRPYQPYRPARPDVSMPGSEDPRPPVDGPQAGSQPDPDGTMRAPDDEAVIGGDEPPPDRSYRQADPQPPVVRHRDHSGDYNP